MRRYQFPLCNEFVTDLKGQEAKTLHAKNRQNVVQITSIIYIYICYMYVILYLHTSA